MIAVSLPARINVVGAPTDATEGAYAVLSAAVAPRGGAQIAAGDGLTFERAGGGRARFDALPIGDHAGFDIEAAAVNALCRFAPELPARIAARGAAIRTWTDVPASSGMGGSSVLLLAVLAALRAFYELDAIADAVSCALPLLGSEPAYLACACDSVFTAADIAAVIAAGRGRPDCAVVGILDMGAAATASRSAVRLDGERVLEIVEKPIQGSTPSGLVAAPLYWLPRALDPLLASTPERGGERHVSSALSDFLAAGGEVRSVRLSGRIEVTTAEDVERATQVLTSW